MSEEKQLDVSTIPTDLLQRLCDYIKQEGFPTNVTRTNMWNLLSQQFHVPAPLIKSLVNNSLSYLRGHLKSELYHEFNRKKEQYIVEQQSTTTITATTTATTATTTSSDESDSDRESITLSGRTRSQDPCSLATQSYQNIILTLDRYFDLNFFQYSHPQLSILQWLNQQQAYQQADQAIKQIAQQALNTVLSRSVKVPITTHGLEFVCGFGDIYDMIMDQRVKPSPSKQQPRSTASTSKSKSTSAADMDDEVRQQHPVNHKRGDSPTHETTPHKRVKFNLPESTRSNATSSSSSSFSSTSSDSGCSRDTIIHYLINHFESHDELMHEVDSMNQAMIEQKNMYEQDAAQVEREREQEHKQTQEQIHILTLHAQQLEEEYKTLQSRYETSQSQLNHELQERRMLQAQWMDDKKQYDELVTRLEMEKQTAQTQLDSITQIIYNPVAAQGVKREQSQTSSSSSPPPPPPPSH